MKKNSDNWCGIAGLTLANLFKKNSTHEFMLYEKQESLSLDEGYEYNSQQIAQKF